MMVFILIVERSSERKYSLNSNLENRNFWVLFLVLMLIISIVWVRILEGYFKD